MAITAAHITKLEACSLQYTAKLAPQPKSDSQQKPDSQTNLQSNKDPPQKEDVVTVASNVEPGNAAVGGNVESGKVFGKVVRVIDKGVIIATADDSFRFIPKEKILSVDLMFKRSQDARAGIPAECKH
jgi:hypothetical protein